MLTDYVFFCLGLITFVNCLFFCLGLITFVNCAFFCLGLITFANCAFFCLGLISWAVCVLAQSKSGVFGRKREGSSQGTEGRRKVCLEDRTQRPCQAAGVWVHVGQLDSVNPALLMGSLACGCMGRGTDISGPGSEEYAEATERELPAVMAFLVDC